MKRLLKNTIIALLSLAIAIVAVIYLRNNGKTLADNNVVVIGSVLSLLALVCTFAGTTAGAVDEIKKRRKARRKSK